MEEVSLNFETCAVIVINSVSNFKGTFQTICKALEITYWCISRVNHKGKNVENFHRFWNKTQTITGSDRGTHAGFIQNEKTSQYAWTSAPIDDTDISQRLAEIGRYFLLPLDVDICDFPSTNTFDNSAIFQYLRGVSTDSQFSASVLQVLVKERCRRQRELHISTITDITSLKLGDIVKAHVKIQSKSESGIVKKISYQAKGPFIVTKDPYHSAFEVEPYNRPNGATHK